MQEAAGVLRIGRTMAYELARSYQHNGEGLPVVRIGRLLRVPRAALEAFVGVSLQRSGSWPSERSGSAS